MGKNQLVGLAGEHWVCSMLARRGWSASLTRDGIERTDILAVRTGKPQRRMIEVQVKTATDAGEDLDTSIPFGKSASEFARSDGEWFALVLMPGPRSGQLPRTFIVPRDHVNAARWITYRQWRYDKEYEGKRSTPFDRARTRLWPFKEYEDAWALLESPAFEAEVRLDRRLQQWSEENDYVGLPDGHPWQNNPPRWSSKDLISVT